MNCHAIATLIGIVIQLLGAGYLVWQTRFTAIKLAKYKSNITYGNFAAAIDDLAQEINGQFKQQMRGFLLVGVGSVFQFYGALPT
jgi:uncharacterized membrane protein YidH (DUF202 family)